MENLQTAKQYFKFAELAAPIVDTPTTFLHIHGNDALRTTLISGEYDPNDKAMRGRDADGRMWYIPRRMVLSVEF